MRVSMLHWAFPPVIGGVESHLAMLGPGLAARGWEVSLLTGSLRGAGEMEVYRGVNVERTPLMNLNCLPADVSVLEQDIRQRLREFVEKNRPDIIHAHNLHYFSPVHARVLVELKEEKGIPLVLTAHNVWGDSLWDQCCLLAGCWDGVIAVSNYIARQMVRCGYPEKRVFVVHHGLEYRRFGVKGDGAKGFPKLEGRRVIFHPARMCYDKGSHVALKALELIVHEYPAVVLVMAGTGDMVDRSHLRDDYLARIGAQIRSAGLREHVYIRHFRWEEMPYMYHQAELCIYPSCFEEPFGLALLEANACGRPIVVSRAGGMPEIIRDGVNGFLVPMHDHRALADRCLQLLAEPELARSMGARGRRLVQEKFNYFSMVSLTEEVYRNVLHGLPRAYEYLA